MYKLNVIVIIYKGFKLDRSDHRVGFFHPHLGEMAALGTSWHKTFTGREAYIHSYGLFLLFGQNVSLIFPPYFVSLALKWYT